MSSNAKIITAFVIGTIVGVGALVAYRAVKSTSKNYIEDDDGASISEYDNITSKQIVRALVQSGWSDRKISDLLNVAAGL